MTEIKSSRTFYANCPHLTFYQTKGYVSIVSITIRFKIFSETY